MADEFQPNIRDNYGHFNALAVRVQHLEEVVREVKSDARERREWEESAHDAIIRRIEEAVAKQEKRSDANHKILLTLLVGIIMSFISNWLPKLASVFENAAK